MQEKRIAELLGIPEQSTHFEQAVTHPSFANERSGVSDNQRLEFLGDAVLGLVTSQILFERFPDADEGNLTRMRAQLVNAEALACWARAQDLSEVLRLGKGALASIDNTNVLADAVEALIAAVLLESGWDAARSACAVIIEAGLGGLAAESTRDPKSELQERVQASGKPAPTYAVIDSGGPAHDRWFSVAVQVSGQTLGEGRGRSKRAAERAAAQRALERGGDFDTGTPSEPEEVP